MSLNLLQTGFALQKGVVKEATGRPSSAMESGDNLLPSDVLDHMHDDDELSLSDSLSLMQTGITHQRGPVDSASSPFSEAMDEDEMAGLQDMMSEMNM